MVESNFMKVYDELSMLNEKWYASKEYWGRIWFSDSAVQFKNFMMNLSTSGMKGVRLAIAPDFYLVANAADFNHDMMIEVAKEEFYLDVPEIQEFTTCGVPKCTDFELENYETTELRQEAEDNPEDEELAKYLDYDPGNDYQGMLIADYGTFEIALYNFIAKACPEYVSKNNKTSYFEDTETYKVLKPLLKRIYIYSK